MRLVEWGKNRMDQNGHMDMVDANIMKDELSEEKVLQFFRISMLCTAESWKVRPHMKEVIELLDRI